MLLLKTLTEKFYGLKLENFFGQINPSKTFIKQKYGHLFGQEILVKYNKGYIESANVDHKNQIPKFERK